MKKKGYWFLTTGGILYISLGIFGIVSWIVQEIRADYSIFPTSSGGAILFAFMIFVILLVFGSMIAFGIIAICLRNSDKKRSSLICTIVIAAFHFILILSAEGGYLIVKSTLLLCVLLCAIGV